MNGERALALVSGGLDSIVALAAARRTLDVRAIVFFDYGQRSRESERQSVLAVAAFYELPVIEVDLPWLGALAPEGMREGATSDALDTLGDVWVPNRNGVFLAVAAAYAEARGARVIVCGFNREEAQEFPDNTLDFVRRTNAALELSTSNGVRVHSDTIGLDKREILRLGHELGAPLSVVWSCYRSAERMCGRCASCRRLRAALASTPADIRPVIEFEVDS